MPTSKVQAIAAAIAEHHPEKLYKRNRSLLSMSQEQLHEFSSASRKGLPTRAPKKKRKNLLGP